MTTTTTLAGDGQPRRKGESPVQIVRSAELPASLGELVLAVTGKTRLWAAERSDVARELCNHFAEGLAAGAEPGAMAAAFGNPARAARLIARAKKRNRPWAWRAARYAVRATFIFFMSLIGLYLLLTIRYYWGKPVISHNYLTEFNAPSLAVPKEQRAWPIYRQAYLAIPPLRDEAWISLADKWPVYAPADAQWPKFLQYVQASQPMIADIRRAAAMERSAFLASTESPPPQDKSSTAPMDPLGVEEPKPDLNGPSIGILLPQLGAYRNMARLLKADVVVATERGDGSTVAADFAAMIGLARHAGEDRTLIAQLVALAILQLTDDAIGQTLDQRPQLLTDAQWRTTAHRLAAWRLTPTGPGDQLDLSVERYFMYDLVQRMFTDNGHGDGHFVDSKMLRSDFGMVEPPAVSFVGPVASAVFAGRADTVKMYDELMGLNAQAFQQPPYARDSGAIDRRLAELRSSAKGIRYAFITGLVPAVSRAQASADTGLQLRDATLAAIALELFKRTNGHYPQTLAELVPTYLPTLPLDRWSGRALPYKVQGSELTGGKPMLYSIGANMIDDGGELNTPWFPQAAATRKTWPAQTGEILTKDWILWPPIEAKGAIPPYYPPAATEEHSAVSDMLRGLMPWNSLVGN